MPTRRQDIDDERELQLKVALQGAQPPIWRRVVVRERMTLAALHRAIQEAMGWEDCHLYEFEVGGGRFSTMDPDAPPKTSTSSLADLRSLHLRTPGTRFIYEYDFGDGWRHLVEVEAVRRLDRSATYPRCIGGRRACPPEDCGGVHGYATLLSVLADPSHPEHRQLSEWIPPDFDPSSFDLDEANLRLDEAFRSRTGQTATP